MTREGFGWLSNHRNGFAKPVKEKKTNRGMACKPTIRDFSRIGLTKPWFLVFQ